MFWHCHHTLSLSYPLLGNQQGYKMQTVELVLCSRYNFMGFTYEKGRKYSVSQANKAIKLASLVDEFDRPYFKVSGVAALTPAREPEFTEVPPTLPENDVPEVDRDEMTDEELENTAGAGVEDITPEDETEGDEEGTTI